MPTPTVYTFTISTDTLNAKVNSDSLNIEIRASSIITSLDYITTEGDTLNIRFKDALSSEDQASLSSIVAAHTGAAPAGYDVPMVKIAAETVPTQGYYQTTSVVVDITQSGINTKDISFPFPISLYSATYNVIDGEVGDYIECIVAPDKVIGALSAPTSSGNAVIHVSTPVMDKIGVGFYCNIYNAANNTVHELGRIVAKDAISGTLTVETPPTLTISPAGPAYVRVEAALVEHEILPQGGQVTLGRTLKGGSSIAAGTVIRFNYFDVNGNDTGKKFIAILEYFY